MAPDGERGKFLQRTPATWLDGQNVFTFSTLPPGSRSLDIWTFAGSATAHVRKREISEESVKNWLRESAPERNGQTPTAGLRLIEVTSADCKGAIPSSKETLEQLFDRWGLPCLETPWIPLYAGGSSLSIAESRDGTRVNFLLGGTRYKRAIGGVFSYHCQSNVTSGIVISGSDLSPWIVELPTLFLRLPHPMTIVVAMGEALMETVLTLKARYRARVKQIEGMSQRAIETNSPLQDHRLLAIELGLLNWLNAKSKIGFERSHAQFKFALQHLQSPDGPFSHETCRSKLEAACQTLLSRTSFSLASLETLGLEHDSNQSRFETQRLIVSNLIAQQDVNLSVTMAKDSNVIAAASRRDSSVMRIIAILGMVFLPATFTATFFTIPLLYNSGSGSDDGFSSRIWIYFAVAIPITLMTMTIMLWWLPRVERKESTRFSSVGSHADLETQAPRLLDRSRFGFSKSTKGPCEGRFATPGP